ncbi:chymotrypsin-2-like [Aricia agestis]|uniref:chymotrypsin-2-like n=1 Tax=Aricia agestis TaxID=91739 RepID=UPI001C208B9E|nr:chymotrypsin-2-like [Aricia agestis]
MYKSSILFLTLLVGSFAFPAEDFSIFFDHTDPSASRIVGGSVAQDPVPHMVAMTNGLLIRSFLCGGSVITTRHVLTAAHCIEAVFSWGSLSSNLRVTVGTNRWNTGGTHYNIARNITHQNYVSSIIKNDIGILVTASEIALTNAVQPVRLNYDWIGEGIATRVNGWGRVVTGGAISAVLLELHATSVDGQRCIEEVAQRATELNIRGVPPVQPHIELCTFRATNMGACNGDSGSALLRVDRGEQIGVVSWGLPCARGAPDMFVRVSAFRDWIQQSIA